MKKIIALLLLSLVTLTSCDISVLESLLGGNESQQSETISESEQPLPPSENEGIPALSVNNTNELSNWFLYEENEEKIVSFNEYDYNAICNYIRSGTIRLRTDNPNVFTVNLNKPVVKAVAAGKASLVVTFISQDGVTENYFMIDVSITTPKKCSSILDFSNNAVDDEIIELNVNCFSKVGTSNIFADSTGFVYAYKDYSNITFELGADYRLVCETNLYYHYSPEINILYAEYLNSSKIKTTTTNITLTNEQWDTYRSDEFFITHYVSGYATPFFDENYYNKVRFYYSSTENGPVANAVGSSIYTKLDYAINDGCVGGYYYFKGIIIGTDLQDNNDESSPVKMQVLHITELELISTVDPIPEPEIREVNSFSEAVDLGLDDMSQKFHIQNVAISGWYNNLTNGGTAGRYYLADKQGFEILVYGTCTPSTEYYWSSTAGRYSFHQKNTFLETEYGKSFVVGTVLDILFTISTYSGVKQLFVEIISYQTPSA